jgi:hypothetical protein
MKKIYLSVIAFGLAASASAQQGMHGVTQSKEALRTVGEDMHSPQSYTPFHQLKASGDIVWSEEFNGGSTGWTTGGPQDIWAFSTSGPSGQYSTPADEIIESTTVGNGFMMFNADGNQPGAPSTFVDHVGWMQSPVLPSLVGFTELTLTFEHTYRTCCANGFVPQVEVSDDGFTTSETYNVGVPGVDVNSAAPTTLQKVDLSGFIAGATDLTNVQIRFLFDGTGGTSHYWWQVDDVAVIESFNNDILLNEFFLASGTQKVPYHQVPVEQLVDVEFSGIISNLGAATQNDVQLEVLADDGTNQSTFNSAGLVQNAGASDSVATTSNWLPAGVAGTTFDLTLSATQTEAEQAPLDNERTEVFTITDSVYSVDNGTIGGSISNFDGNSEQAFKIGNVMEIMNDTYITSMSVYVSDRQDSQGQQIYGELQKSDGTAFNFEAITSFYSLQAGDLGTIVTIPFQNPIQVAAGDVILLLAGHQGSGSTAIADVTFGSAQRIPQGNVLGAGADNELANLIDPRAVIVRANLDQTISVDELANNNVSIGHCYPNPFSNKTTVGYNLKNSGEVSYSVVDLSGKSIVEVNEGVVAAGGHEITIDRSNMSAGMYYLNMNIAGENVTRKLIVK